MGDKSVVRTRIQVDGAKEAETNLKRVERAFDSFAQNGLQAEEKLRSIGPAAAVAVAGFIALEQAAQAVVSVTKEIASAFVELGKRGGEVAGIETAFRRLADPSMLSGLQEATAGMLSATELMQRTNRVLSAGLVRDQQEITEWFGIVTQASSAMGLEVSDSIEEMAETLSGAGFSENFEKYGLNVLKIEEATEALGLTVDSQEGQLVALRFAMAELQQQYGNTTPEITNLNQAFTSITTAVTDWVDEVASSFSQNEALVGFFSDISEVLRTSTPEAETFSQALAEFFTSAILLTKGLLEVAEPLVEVLLALGRAAITLQQVVSVLNPAEWIGLGPDYDAMRDQIDSVESAMGEITNTIDGMSGAFDNLRRRTDTLKGGFDESVDGAYTLKSAYADLSEGVGSFIAEVTRIPFIEADSGTRTLALSQEELARRTREAADAAREEAEVLARLAAIVDEGDSEVESIFAGRIDPDRAAALASALGRGASAETPSRGGGGRRREERVDPKIYEVEAAEKARDLQADRYDWELNQLGLTFERIDAENELADKEAEAQQRRQEALEEYKEKQSEYYEMQNEAMEAAIAKEQEMVDRRFDQVSTAVSAAQNLGGQIQEILGMAAEERQQEVDDIRKTMEAMGKTEAEINKATKAREKDIEKLKKAEGAFLIAFNIAWAAVEVASAAKEFASQNYFSGAMHIVSAVSYGVAAGIAAARLGGGSASAPAVSAGSFTPAKEEKMPKAEEGGKDGGVTLIQQYSLGRTEGELATNMQDSVWEQKRAGLAQGGNEAAQYGV